MTGSNLEVQIMPNTTTPGFYGSGTSLDIKSRAGMGQKTFEMSRA